MDKFMLNFMVGYLWCVGVILLLISVGLIAGVMAGEISKTWLMGCLFFMAAVFGLAHALTKEAEK